MAYGNASAESIGSHTIRDPLQQKTMDGLLSGLDKHLMGIREGVNQLTEFRHRLLNPRAADGSKAGAPEPKNPLTIEGRLALSVHYAEALAQELNDLCSELDRAA